jgi:putative transposase
VPVDPAEVQRGVRDRVSQGQERAVRIHRQAGEKRVFGLHFWSVGYCVSTVGLDEQMIREYIQQQEQLETGQNTLDFE